MWKAYALVAALGFGAWVLGYHAGFEEGSKPKPIPPSWTIKKAAGDAATRNTPPHIVSITLPDSRTCAVEYDAKGHPFVTDRCHQDLKK